MKDNLTTNASNEAESPAFLVGAVMPSCLRLSLKTKWFEMTKAGIKTEDYRELSPYWARRLEHRLLGQWRLIFNLTFVIQTELDIL